MDQNEKELILDSYSWAVGHLCPVLENLIEEIGTTSNKTEFELCKKANELKDLIEEVRFLIEQL